MIIKAKKIFTGDQLISDHHLVIEGDKITSVLPNQRLAKHSSYSSEKVIDFKNAVVVPGFIDVHINGGGGILFNNQQDPAALIKILQAHARFGTTGILPTLITDTEENTEKAMSSVSEVISTNEIPGIHGIHIEGPFINPLQKGTHNPNLMLKPNSANLKKFCRWGSAFAGKKILTLAPELFSPAHLQDLNEGGFIIMAGHTHASYEIMEKCSPYLTGITHFYNGMGKASARLPQTIGYVFDKGSDFWLTLIIDGFHIHPAMLRLLFSLHPFNRTILITDAMATVGSNIKSFRLQNKKITLKKNLLFDEFGTISGAHLTMIGAANHLYRMNAQLSIEEILRMASLYPAEFLGYNRPGQNYYGRLKKGYQADLTIIDHSLETTDLRPLSVISTMINGKWVWGEPIS